MGNLEKENRKIVRRTKIQEAILLTLVSGGRMGSELITEALINSLLGTDFSLLPRKKEIIKSSTNRLREKGLLKFENGRYVLTQAGQATLGRWKLLDFNLPKP